MTKHDLFHDSIDTLCGTLARDGWCIVAGALPASSIAALDEDLSADFAATPFCQGGFYGETTKRFGRVLTRSDHAAALVQHDVIKAVAEKLLLPWCDRIQLNVGQAIAVHPGAPAQLPHRDQDMWRAPVGEVEYLLNVLWPLTPFRADNGATRVWTNSHGTRVDAPQDEADGIAAEMMPGDALLVLGSTLHGAGANRSSDVRRAIVVGYSLGWLKAYENMSLAYPPAVARHFPAELAALVGYQQHRPNLGNFEGQCPSVLLQVDVPDHFAAIDALRPDQQELMGAYIEQQRQSA
ncbi:phytanoyl-CoA dioxygenase family protein [Sphingomonas immobilis]|uniref:Phytanoyl-CoA dioxygenase family protein n=1 Tax=Sphingomonas immobilis TaxID=3063997 RepID=A0ABT9A202_9SPHN|nr:phytanoyl-CoA dioxygenase family protein [Sphingomonas sp. CA1-15]MDO7843588.1 phytanoyl-CoA dioxygenase family protein [Sphingomonas sp. CA1-15]